MKTKHLLIALVALVALSACLDDGPAVAAMAQKDYCERVAAGTHSDYDHKCPETKP